MRRTIESQECPPAIEDDEERGTSLRTRIGSLDTDYSLSSLGPSFILNEKDL